MAGTTPACPPWPACAGPSGEFALHPGARTGEVHAPGVALAKDGHHPAHVLQRLCFGFADHHGNSQFTSLANIDTDGRVALTWWRYARPGAPKKRQYEPKPEAAAQGVACCDVVNRGPSYADG